MKKIIYLLVSLLCAQAIGQTNQYPKSAGNPVKIHSNQNLEERSVRTPLKKSNPTTFRKVPGGNRITASGNNFTIRTLGTSVNPYTLALYPQRQIVDYDPKSNMLMLTRRGGEGDLDFSPATTPGNALYYDLSNDGGFTWSMGLGPVFKQPSNTQAIPNWLKAPRYPIGILVNPKKSANQANVFGFFSSALVVNSDNTWGGETFGIRRVSTTDTTKLSMLEDSSIFKPDASAKNSRNEIFSVQILNETDENSIQTPINILRINKVSIDTITNQFTRTEQEILLPVPDPGLEYILNESSICFAREGGQGYITVTGRIPSLSHTPLPVNYLLVYQTQDFGQTWTGPYTADLTMDPDFSASRLVFLGDSSFNVDSTALMRVYYTLLPDFDSEVDFQNNLHFFGTISTAPNDEGSSLNMYYPKDLGLIHFSTSPSGLTNSSWTVHSTQRTQSRFGFFGDTEDPANRINHYFFPQIAFSEDRRTILLSHTDTDTTIHSSTDGFHYNNSPDLFVQKGKHNGSSWVFSQFENETKDSDLSGKIFWPRLANCFKMRGDTTEFFVSTMQFPDSTPVFDITDYPIQHLLLHFNGKLNPSLNSAYGRVFDDRNGNCLFDAGDKPMAYSKVQFAPFSQFTYTDTNGVFQANLPQGIYRAKYVPLPILQNVHTTPCLVNASTPEFSFPTDSGGFVSNLALPVHIEQCAKISLKSFSGILRPCRRSGYRVQATNAGTDTAWNVRINIKIPSLLRLISSSPVATFSPTDSTYLITIPFLRPNSTFQVTLVDSVICPASPQLLVGLNQCFLTRLTYENECVQTNPLWDKVDLEASGKCESDGIRFKIKNKGLAMTQSRKYSIFKDSLLVFQDSVLLAAGDSLIMQIPNSQNASVYRIQVPQSMYHPLGPRSSSNARCLFSSPSNGATSEMASEDLSELLTQACERIRASIDPNDKDVWPRGAGEFDKTLPDSWLEYKIRFMNKGNDTAFNIVVVDTISQHLDLETFEPGLISHSYSIKMKPAINPIITFTFNNIQLVDSATNTPKSSGFISFKIKPKSDAPLGTEIRNRAAIYFDFNDPVLTNYTLNTLYNPALTTGIVDSVHIVTSSKVAMSNPGRFVVFPNPNKGKVTIQTDLAGEKQFVVSDLMGKSLMRKSFEGSTLQLDCSGLPKGTYFIRVVSGGRIQNGKMMVE